MVAAWISGGLFLLVLTIFFPQNLSYRPRRGQLQETIEALTQAKNYTTDEDGDNWYHRYCKPSVFKLQLAIEKWFKFGDSEILKQSLIRAGLDRSFSVEDLRGLKLACALIASVYTLLLLVSEPSLKSLCIGICIIWLAVQAPDEWLKRRAKRRKAAIARELPVVLNTLAIVTEAGLNLIPAIQEVCQHGRGILIDELRITLREIAMGQAQGSAFSAMAQRCGEPELARFLSILVQGLEKGSSGVVEILKKQARDCWHNRRKHAEELGQKASFKMFLPLIVFFFPAMTMFVLGPAILILIENFINF